MKTELKAYKRKRRLNSRVKFVLNQLSHYKFKQHLFSKAKEYGCLCVEVTEEYTSQLCAKCGRIDKLYVDRMKKCKKCKHKINRDVNGARNILLKYMSEFMVKR
jgi:putative transposase